MTNKTQIKICGITEVKALETAIDSGAAFCGFVFHKPSSRAVSMEQAAALSSYAGHRIKKVGLFVDSDDSTLDSILKRGGLDMIQLHGHETPERVNMIRMNHRLPVIKAIAVATRDDLKNVSAYEAVSDWLLFDAKVPGQAGGTGRAFDWSLLSGFKSSKPWMLSGGLNAENIGIALSLLKPTAVDVSSGVEDAPGLKSPEKIRAFIEAVRK